MTVWKYGPLVPGFELTVPMPRGAEVRHFAEFNGLHFWAEVDPAAPKELRRFMAVGTGWEQAPGLRYHGTAIAGEFVWHLYELPK